MTHAPQHLYTRQDDIARMEALILQLPDEAMVELKLSSRRAELAPLLLALRVPVEE